MSAGIAVVGGVFLSENMIKRTSGTYWGSSPFLRQYLVKQKALSITSVLCLCSALVAQLFAASGRTGITVKGSGYFWFPVVIILPTTAFLYQTYRFLYGRWYFGNKEVPNDLKQIRELTENIKQVEDTVPGRNALIGDKEIILMYHSLLGWKVPSEFHPNQVNPEMGERIYKAFEKKYGFYSRFYRG